MGGSIIWLLKVIFVVGVLVENLFVFVRSGWVNRMFFRFNWWFVLRIVRLCGFVKFLVMKKRFFVFLIEGFFYVMDREV